jgi:hypothetical protein
MHLLSCYIIKQTSFLLPLLLFSTVVLISLLLCLTPNLQPPVALSHPEDCSLNNEPYEEDTKQDIHHLLALIYFLLAGRPYTHPHTDKIPSHSKPRCSPFPQVWPSLLCTFISSVRERRVTAHAFALSPSLALSLRVSSLSHSVLLRSFALPVSLSGLLCISHSKQSQTDICPKHLKQAPCEQFSTSSSSGRLAESQSFRGPIPCSQKSLESRNWK